MPRNWLLRDRLYRRRVGNKKAGAGFAAQAGKEDQDVRTIAKFSAKVKAKISG